MGSLFKRRIGQHLFFIHVMKTGGTSLRKMLIAELGEKAIYPNEDELKTLPNGWYPSSEYIQQQAGKLRKHKVLIGHHPFSLYPMLDKKYKPVIFLREPVSRTISIIGHRKRNSPEYSHMSYEEILDNREFAQNQVINYQTKVLSMGMGAVNLFHPTKEEDLNAAIENLRHFIFVGIHEYFYTSCLLFDRLFQTKITRQMRHDNCNTSEFQISEKLISKIKPLIAYDEVLYQEALKRFRRDLQENQLQMPES